MNDGRHRKESRNIIIRERSLFKTLDGESSNGRRPASEAVNVGSIPTSPNGKLAEWLKAPVLKTGVVARPPGVQIPHFPLRDIHSTKVVFGLKGYFRVEGINVLDMPRCEWSSLKISLALLSIVFSILFRKIQVVEPRGDDLHHVCSGPLLRFGAGLRKLSLTCRL